MRSINEIIVHYSETPEGREVTVEEIDSWHRQKGYKCIGYHFVIYLDGSVHAGRELNEIGAHCRNHNSHSIGICYVGGVRNGVKCDTRTDAQKASMYKLLKILLKKFPDATLHGHNEFSSKECPGFNVQEEYKNLIKMP